MYIYPLLTCNIRFSDLNEASLLWNLKIRYDKELIYVSIVVKLTAHPRYLAYIYDA